MLNVIALVSTFYLQGYTGELAGMRNVLLQPQYAVGVRNEFDLNALPDLHTSIDVYGLYGEAKTGTGSVSSEFQEVRGKITSLYTVYNQDDIFSVNTGLYSRFASPLHHYLPYREPDPNVEYAKGENERIANELLLGWDLNFTTRYDRISTSLDNIVFFTGKKIAPNLLAYVPSIAFEWTNQMFILGTVNQPRLAFAMDVEFWFARKADVNFFNSHDGIGGTKREFYLSYGFNYWLSKQMELSVKSFGDNNLNRGESISEPKDFRDGAVFGISYAY